MQPEGIKDIPEECVYSRKIRYENKRHRVQG